MRCKQVAVTDEVALTGGATRTILQIVAGANPLAIQRWGVFFDGVTGDAQPVRVEIKRQTDAGISAPGTVSRLNTDDGITPQAAARIDFSGEPSGTNILDIIECHPQMGYEAVLAEEDWIFVPANGRLGIVLTAPANVNVQGKFHFTELINESTLNVVHEFAGSVDIWDFVAANGETPTSAKWSGYNTATAYSRTDNTVDATKTFTESKTFNSTGFTRTFTFNAAGELLGITAWS
jgi:hypothetical protein